MLMSHFDPEIGAMEFSLNMPGKYKRNGNTLTLKMNSPKSELKLSKIEFTSEMEVFFEDNPELKKNI